MARIFITASAVIDASPKTIYAIIADYENEHPKILPHRHLSDLTVERGGVGEGTIIRYQVHVLGQTRTVRAAVHEPEPGRMISETDLDTGAVTTFLVEPIKEGRAASVTISTEWNKSGVVGLIIQLTAPSLLRRVYAEELQKLSRRAQEVDLAGSGHPA